MDTRKIDKMVRKFYGRWWKELAYVVLSSVISTAGVFWVLCLILGNPFTYEADALFFTVTFYGWLDEQPYMYAVWIGLAAGRFTVTATSSSASRRCAAGLSTAGDTFSGAA